MKNNSIFKIKDYGKISFHVKEIMDSKELTRSKLAKLANTRFEVANKWYKGNIERMDIDILYLPSTETEWQGSVDCPLYEL